MSSNEFKFFADLAARTAEMNQKFQVDPEKLTGCTGTDQTGSVRAVINSTGLVRSVAVEPEWRTALRPHELGGAVLAAVRAANKEQLTVWAGEVQANDSAPQPVRTPAPEPEHDVPSPAIGGEHAAAVEEVFGLLDKMTKELAGITEGLTTLQTARTVGQSPGRHVTVTLTGKQLTQVEIDPPWTAQANHREITGEIRGAIKAAYEQARRTAAETLATSASTQLQALAADPAVFLRKLGLPAR